MNNNVIYKIPCSDCNASYVDQIKRQLGTRLKKHRHNIKLDQSNHSVVLEHILPFNHVFDWNKILDITFTIDFIHIKEQSNRINSVNDMEFLGDAYGILREPLIL